MIDIANIDKNPRKNVSHHSIFDYWKDKVILDTGEIKTIGDVFEKMSPDKYVRVVYDWGEPCCWGCDKPNKHKNRLDKFSTLTKTVNVDGKERESYLYCLRGVLEICRSYC